MRLRNVKEAYDRIHEFERVIETPTDHKGHWDQVFGNANPIHIEIGMGKGQFLIDMAKANPQTNYIGFEKFTVVLVKALDKMNEEDNIDNLRVIRMDAKDLTDIFEVGEVGRVYLNFSDPWPKERHAKRRLTSHRFLPLYEKVLEEDGRVIFKTDNRPLFDYSMESIKEHDMVIYKETYDLHQSPYVEGNVMTEYETKFHEQGLPIHMVEAGYKKK